MIRNRLLQIAQLSAVGLTGFYIGQNKDKFSNYSNDDSIIIDGKRLRSMPGLPVFGTVSAATPYTDSGSSKDRVSQIMKSQNSDYKGSGFDRGHMAAAGNHRLSQKHVEQTFFLTNMAPQVGEGFNRHAWNTLEKHVRKLTKVYSNVYCCTGPLYLPRRESDGKSYIRYQVIGANTVAVPTHFYKVVVGETRDGTLDMEAYVMPNQKIPDETPVSAFMVPPESIEKAAGLLFFDKIHRSKLNKINGKKV
ncbi:hypothetical protein HW555_009735 [Spodoptera exigua]|uniref:Endonuclease n=1 Tax=Spodoptera exigua TaxID=7107 RepID=A0A835L1K2_SPOEX|nr:hypothetical protein HW555_009735 [Spodoptera exigua]